MTFFLEKDMYDNVYSVLRARYPLKDGWDIKHLEHHKTYVPDFIVERTKKGIIEKVIVEVKRSHLSQPAVNQLNAYARNLAGPNVRIVGKIFVVPAGADTSVAGEDFQIIYLKSFKI